MDGPTVGLLEDDVRVRRRFEEAITRMPGWSLAFSVGYANSPRMYCWSIWACPMVPAWM